ncbi:MAG: DUF883 family protein [Burkholderiaceae bacterium]|nr:DUF883 family protein [Burkholderiaceae bacterium]
MATVSDNAKNVIEEGADMADKAITTVASKASSAASRFKEVADDAVDNGSDALENALICTKDMVRANPIATVAIVAAIAYLWGRMK